MKKWLAYLLKTLAAILTLLLAVILFFTLQANLRETKTRQDAAPSTGRCTGGEVNYRSQYPVRQT